MKKSRVFRFVAASVVCLLLFPCLPVKGQVLDEGVTSSGKEVDCNTIDPSADNAVNEQGKVVAQPRLTRNGKLITTDCGGLVTLAGKSLGGFCVGGDTTIVYSVSTDITGGVIYKWYVDDVEQGSDSAKLVYRYTTAGAHTVKCEVSSTSGPNSGSDELTTTITEYPLPTLTISGDKIICSGENGTLTATSGLSNYVWSSNVVSATGNSATVNAAGTYSVTATGNHGCTNHTSATVTVSNPLVTSAVTISGDNSVCYNEGTTLAASATASTGATLAYQWYKNGSAITGATSSTLNTGNLTDASTTFKCEVEAEIDGCVSAVSEASKVITVIHPIAGTVSVSADATTLCSGGNTTVRASVTGNTGTLSYQWYLGSSAISGATSNTYNVTNISASGTYKCEVTATVNGCTATATNSVTVTVPTPTPGTISITTDPIIICYNSSAEIIATATGNVGTLSYQWYLNDALIPGATSSTYTTGNLTATSTFKCVITATQDGCTSSSTTASKEVIVNNPSVTSTVGITGDANVCAGSTTTLTASATASSGATLTYQWYKNSSIISGATAQSYTTEAINAATTYKCVVTAKIGDCTSAPKEANTTVNIIPITLSDVTITPATANICPGATAQFTASATGSGTVTYQWKQASTEVATTAAFTTPALTGNTTYTCYATSTYNGCTLTKSANASVVVVKPTVGTLSVEGGAVCYNGTKTLQVQATGNNGTLSYQWSTGGSDITGATSGSYTTPALTATTAYTVNVTATVTSPITCTATGSRTVTVTVAQPVYDTLEICPCKLPHTFHYSGGTLTFTNAEMDLHSPRIDTLTKTYPIGSCPDAGHFTVVLWDPDAVVSTTSCPGIVFPNHTTSTNEVVSGNTLNAVSYNGYTYKVVQIGNQCWLKENLRTKLKPDGSTPIVPAIGNSNADNTYYKFSGNITFQSGCRDETIDFDEYERRFGLMYNWFTAMNTTTPAYGLTNYQGICPDGWHIPDTTEFQSMANYVGIVGEWSNPNWGVGDQISTGQHGVRLATGCEWKSSTVPTSPGDYSASDRNSSGFSARPSGCWNNAPAPGAWFALGDWAFFWSSTREVTGVAGGVAAYNFDLHPDWAGLSRDKNGDDQSIGRSVRCIRNEESVIGINGVTSGEEQATCSYQVAIAGQNGVCWSTSPNPTKDDAYADVASVAGTYNATLSPLAENTLYYVRAYVMVDGAPVYSNQVTVSALSKPVVVTMPAVSGTTSATLKGNVTNDGGYSNTTRGICWGTSANPTLSDNVLTDTGNGVGEYSLTATSLSAGVTYHCRAYATNDRGTTYGADVEFVVNTCTGTMSDTDTPPYTHTYPIGQLGSYCWMLSSMRSANLSNGTQVNYIIENVWNVTAAAHTNTPTLYKTKSTKNNSGTGFVEFGTAHHDTYGYYYNYAAAKQICPEGWHLPTWAEWNDLEAWAISNYGCSGGAAQALAAPDTWAYSGTSCHPGYNPSTTNNLSEFKAYPCGCVVNGMNNSFQLSVNFWVDAGDQGNWVYLNHNNANLQKSTSGGGNQHGMSVRCVRDHD